SSVLTILEHLIYPVNPVKNAFVVTFAFPLAPCPFAPFLMHIGTLTVVIHLGEGSSLKDKRQVIKSLVETTRQKFNVSIAEADDLDIWRRATIGVACVSNEAGHANRVLDKVLDTIEANPVVSVGEV